MVGIGLYLESPKSDHNNQPPENFSTTTFGQLLLALADWSENQQELQSAAYYLEQAAVAPLGETPRPRCFASPLQSQSQRESPPELPKAE